MERPDRIIQGMAVDGHFRVIAAQTTTAVETAREILDLAPVAAEALGRAMTGALLLARLLDKDVRNQFVSLRFEGKVPGPVMRLGTVKMDFQYEDYFGATLNTGYETLLYDVMTADSTLFHRSDMVEVGWNVVTPILDIWKALPPRNFPNYAAGTWGPKEADDLLRDGRKWRN